MAEVGRYLSQALAYGAFAALLGYLSTSPSYAPIGPNQAVVALSFVHQGQRLSECRKRSEQEMAKLPPNMRLALDCPRERAAVYVELYLDGRPLYRRTVAPSGLSRDGASYVYRRFQVPAGRHLIEARMRDSTRRQGFDYRQAKELTLAPADSLTVGFDSQKGVFTFA